MSPDFTSETEPRQFNESLAVREHWPVASIFVRSLNSELPSFAVVSARRGFLRRNAMTARHNPATIDANELQCLTLLVAAIAHPPLVKLHSVEKP